MQSRIGAERCDYFKERIGRVDWMDEGWFEMKREWLGMKRDEMRRDGRKGNDRDEKGWDEKG